MKLAKNIDEFITKYPKAVQVILKKIQTIIICVKR